MHHITTQSPEPYIITTPGVHTFCIKNISTTLVVIIDAPHATIHIVGHFDTHDTETYIVQLHQHHRAPHSESHAHIRTIGRGTATVSITGTITIDAIAHGTHASFTSNALIASGTPIIHARPLLSLVPHDIHCTHAVTIGPPDPDQVRYLCSRGITRYHAKKLIAEHFLDSAHI